MTTFVFHGFESTNPAQEFGPVQAEFERRGFPCCIFRSVTVRPFLASPKLPTRMRNHEGKEFAIAVTKTPNQDRTEFILKALEDVEGDIALVGVSNQGLFLPMVAAARPIRRIVLINALIPHPGQSFVQGSKGERIWANFPTGFVARRAFALKEVCPLTELPQVEYIYICGEKDNSISPQWQQWAARTYLHVEPTIVKDAGHSSILVSHVSEVVDAATQGL